MIFNQQKYYILFIILLLLIVIMPMFASSEELTLNRTVYLEHSHVVDPKAIIKGNNGDLIIVGSIDQRNQPKSAWATKTDSEGNVKWRYIVPPREILQNPQWSPQYSSASVMSDDSVFLCGGMPFNKSGAGLLTHLDKDGKLISEQLISPEGLSGGGAHSCIADKDGLIFLGGTATLTKNELNARFC